MAQNQNSRLFVLRWPPACFLILPTSDRDVNPTQGFLNTIPYLVL
jgi:hypothetical protein